MVAAAASASSEHLLKREFMLPNDPSSATRPTSVRDCNLDVMAGALQRMVSPHVLITEQGHKCLNRCLQTRIAYPPNRKPSHSKTSEGTSPRPSRTRASQPIL